MLDALRRFARLAAISVTLGITAGACSPEPARNLVIICVDTLRADHLSSYGYARDTAPRLDGLAREGTLFTQAQSTSNWTAPAVASLLTGLYPMRHGVVLPGEPKHLSRERQPGSLRQDIPTLADLLAAQGFSSLLISGNPFLRGRIQQSFQKTNVKYLDARDQIAEIEGWIDDQAENGSKGRFFLYWQIMDLHAPVDPPAAFARRYAASAPAKFPTANHSNWSFGRLATESDARFAEYRDLRIALYDGALDHVDALIGRLLDRLKEYRLDTSTVVVVTSDHGEEFWDHWSEETRTKGDPRDLWGIGHGHTMYQELLRVPLILAGDGVPAGRRVDCPVSLVDVFPTVLELLGVEGAGAIDGTMLPLERSSAGCRPRALWSEAPAYGPNSVALRVGQTKLIWRADRRTEIFDLSKDPHEKNPLPARQVRDAQRLRTLLERRAEGGVRVPEPAVLDERSVQDLKALGYID